jgi:hypothetical protein
MCLGECMLVLHALSNSVDSRIGRTATAELRSRQMVNPFLEGR